MKTTLTSLSVLFLALLGSALAAVSDFSAIENTPIQTNGREKPFYTFATETLQTLTRKTRYNDGKTKVSAMATVLDIGFHPHGWAERPLISVGSKPLKEAVGLPADRELFSLAELFANEGLKARFEEVEKLNAGPTKPKLNSEQTEVTKIATRIRLAHSLMEGTAFAFVPHPSGPVWLPAATAETAYPGEKGAAVAKSWAEMKTAFLEGNDAAFQSAASQFSSGLASLRPDAYPGAGIMKLETKYNQYHPFRWAWRLYALAAIVLWVTTLWARSAGYRIAWGAMLAGFAFQIVGFTARIIIGGRAPVTNMYESVVWVAFGAVLFALILEAIYRSRYLFLAAAPAAVVCLILADTQTSILDPSIDPLAAVLRDNFWLATHVNSITLSYAAFLLALGVGHIILGKVLFGRPVSAELYNYLYRSLQIGVLLLAIGTVLGGVWANVSWGRFWDWDPKETWALITLLGYLALLHGRIAGWWKGFGLAVGSVFAFLSVLMAWYGVNFVLGEGLHSYGFGTGGFPAVLGFVILEIAFVTLVIARRQKQGQPASAAEEEEEADEPSGMR